MTFDDRTTAVYAAFEDWGSGGDAFTEGLPARIRRRAASWPIAVRPSEAAPEDDVSAPERQLSDLRFG